jgi:hypothetical protein
MNETHAVSLFPPRPSPVSMAGLECLGAKKLFAIFSLGARGTSPAFGQRHDTAAVAGLVPRAPRQRPGIRDQMSDQLPAALPPHELLIPDL